MKTPLRKIKIALVPIGIGDTGQAALTLAKAIAEEVILVGVVSIAEGEPISAGAQVARQIRKRLLSLSNASTRFKSPVIVSEAPWQDLQSVISSEEPDILIIEWEDGKTEYGIPIADVLSHSLCNVAIVRGADPIKTTRTLVAVRGGPYVTSRISKHRERCAFQRFEAHPALYPGSQSPLDQNRGCGADNC
jgi:hypothetical protein